MDNELRRVDSFNEDRYDEALNNATEAQGFWGDDTLNFKPVKIVTLRETKKEGKEAIERILVMTPQMWQKERESWRERKWILDFRWRNFVNRLPPKL